MRFQHIGPRPTQRDLVTLSLLLARPQVKRDGVGGVTR